MAPGTVETSSHRLASQHVHHQMIMVKATFQDIVGTRLALALPPTPSTLNPEPRTSWFLQESQNVDLGFKV